MADIQITVDGGTSKRLLTAGKYCDKNILVTATGGGAGGQELADSIIDRSIKELYSTVSTIGTYALFACKQLITVELPFCTKLEAYSFIQCSVMEDFYAPQLKIINVSAFSSCAKIQKISLPSIENIYASAFLNCSALDTIILSFQKVCSLASSNVFTGTPIASGTGYIYVPKSLVEEYKQATNWTTYADQIRAIEDYPEITGGGQA